jgi:hypothetical protein
VGCWFCFAPRSVVRQAHLPGRGDIVRHNEQGRLEWTGVVIDIYADAIGPMVKDRPEQEQQP